MSSFIVSEYIVTAPAPRRATACRKASVACEGSFVASINTTPVCRSNPGVFHSILLKVAGWNLFQAARALAMRKARRFALEAG